MATYPNTNLLFRPFLPSSTAANADASPVLGTGIAMPSAAPALPAAIGPMVSRTPRASELAQQNYNDAVAKPAGVDAIHNPLVRGIARAGDIAASVFAPRIAQFLPGTTLNHERQVGVLASRAKEAAAEDKSQSDINQDEAQTKQTEALANYTLQRPAIEQSKLDQKKQSAREKYAATLRAKGIDVTGYDEETGLPTTQDNPETMAYQQAAAQNFIHTANAEKAEIQANIAKNGYVPGTPEYEREMLKIRQKDRQIGIAAGNLGIRGKEFEAHAFGTVNGQELPGVLHDESGAPVGTFMNANVKPTTQERDAAGRADTLTDIQSRIEEGLKDPEIQKFMGPLGGRLAEAQGTLGTLPPKVSEFQNDLVSYGAFQAGLHPVRGIGALQYFDKVMGGLHQTPEQLLGKLRSNAATAGAVQKVGEMPTTAGNQRKQTAPNGPSVPSGGAPKAGAIQKGEDGDYRFKGGDRYDRKNWEKVTK